MSSQECLQPILGHLQTRGSYWRPMVESMVLLRLAVRQAMELSSRSIPNSIVSQNCFHFLLGAEPIPMAIYGKGLTVSYMVPLAVDMDHQSKGQYSRLKKMERVTLG